MPYRQVNNIQMYYEIHGDGEPLVLIRSKYPQPRYAFMHQCQASRDDNCTDRLSELHIPTIIMHGKNDKTTSYILAEEMHTGIMGSKMLTFPGGHLFFLIRERQRFLDAIAEFVGP